ncbi:MULTISPECIES: OmpA/MotB family protein [Pseudomonas]|jgi:chemotaxis protein MotB|uniref:Chemotaxis protein MotB n=1 Tax=Pseudomonas extremaustralis TaxID=359110 RepID=A0A5C5Q887_9PSED|nr:OmpA family protein [Pseudomonas extremaustralis]EZI26609.1 protein MotD [Pseudomonas extremaustralis 14-3 substr. 14-3b]TWS01977.1 protein MotD [Pseudomonas extremaustralis]SDG36233.1 chemotaxis protein MotB [Pseudomonas extremaustralis]
MRASTRHQAVAIASGLPPVEDANGETWMMTYLDMMTLLLVVTMAMLALAGKGHERTRQSADLRVPPVFTAKSLTSLQPPGALLRVPQAPEPVTAPEPVVEREPVIASEPVAAAEPAPPKPSAQDLLNELPLDKLGQDIEVVTNDSSVSFRISSEILFPSGQSDLNLGGLAVLQHLIPVLDSVPHKVIVAGHTDTQDMRSARFPSNWELSSARAGSVVRYLQSNGIQPTRLAAIGYADTRPLSDNTTAEGRARNRRVELILER